MYAHVAERLEAAGGAGKLVPPLLQKIKNFSNCLQATNLLLHTCILAILVPAHLYFSNFSACTPVFFAMRDARASASVVSASEARARAKNREKNAKIANGTRLLAHRSRSLRSRSLAHRASRKIQVRRN